MTTQIDQIRQRAAVEGKHGMLNVFDLTPTETVALARYLLTERQWHMEPANGAMWMLHTASVRVGYVYATNPGPDAPWFNRNPEPDAPWGMAGFDHCGSGVCHFGVNERGGPGSAGRVAMKRWCASMLDGEPLSPEEAAILNNGKAML